MFLSFFALPSRYCVLRYSHFFWVCVFFFLPRLGIEFMSLPDFWVFCNDFESYSQFTRWKKNVENTRLTINNIETWTKGKHTHTYKISTSYSSIEKPIVRILFHIVWMTSPFSIIFPKMTQTEIYMCIENMRKIDQLKREHSTHTHTNFLPS